MAFAVQVPRVCERPRSRLLRMAIYWHLLSLDAPTVAVLWAWSFERAARVRISVSALAVLGVGTWLIYVADRLLDARSSRQTELRERHFFHSRHHRTLFAVAVPAAVALLWLIARMPAIDRRDDACLFIVALLYFALVHRSTARTRRWFARELAVGMVFALATAIPAWSQVRGSLPALAMLVPLFAALCCLNTIAIEIWESRDAPGRSAVSMAAGALSVAAAALSFWPGLQHPADTALLACAGLSALLLLALDSLHRQHSAEAAPDDTARWLLFVRIAADAALLTPLLLVVPWR